LIICSFVRGVDIVIFAILLTVTGSLAKADSLFTDNEIIHGRVTGFDSMGLALKTGCTGDQARTLPWTEAHEVIFDDNCSTTPVRLPSAGG
jgi:hypothetical protein